VAVDTTIQILTICVLTTIPELVTTGVFPTMLANAESTRAGHGFSAEHCGDLSGLSSIEDAFSLFLNHD
jgi:hypothetical protein